MQLQDGANVIEIGGKNTYLAPVSGQADLTADLFNNGDVLDLRSALQAVGWDHIAADLPKYLSSTTFNNGTDMMVSTHPLGSNSATMMLTLHSEGGTSLPVLQQHMIF